MRPAGIRRQQQRGAVAIEFAALFMVFFIMLYAIIAYSIPLLLTLTFKQVSADAARAAIKVDPALEAAQYPQVISREVTRVVEQSWLPETWVSGDCPTPAGEHAWLRLPVTGAHPSYGHLAVEMTSPGSARYVLHVCLQRKYNREGGPSERAIMPALDVFNFSIPHLPSEDGETILRGQSTVRL